VLVSRDVIFDEIASWSWGEKHVKEGPLVEDLAFDKVDSAPCGCKFTSGFTSELSSEYSSKFNSKFIQ